MSKETLILKHLQQMEKDLDHQISELEDRPQSMLTGAMDEGLKDARGIVASNIDEIENHGFDEHQHQKCMNQLKDVHEEYGQLFENELDYNIAKDIDELDDLGRAPSINIGQDDLAPSSDIGIDGPSGYAL